MTLRKDEVSVRDISKICIKSDSTMYRALEVINNNSLQIALVVDESRHLLGTITDGDIRRSILKNVPLDADVTNIMTKMPIIVSKETKAKDVLYLMQLKGIHQVPVVDETGIVQGIHVLGDLIASKAKENRVVIMAGGLGTRLRPLTEEMPKPMLRVGDKPILETIIKQLRDHGLTHISLAVNYLADQIENYFGNGEAFGVNIDYICEKTRMGTAGSLTLLNDLNDLNDLPILVMNGDILTNVDFAQLLQFHKEEQVMATMCVRNFDYRVPYGVIELNDNYKVTRITEKPLHSFLVSAGIYVLNPSSIDLIPRGTYFDMPSLLHLIKDLPEGIGCFPIRDYWIDIGEINEYQRANSDFGGIFSEYTKDSRDNSRKGRIEGNPKEKH